MPWDLYHQFREEYQLSDYDASLLTVDAASAQAFLNLCALSKNAKAISNLLINKVLPYAQENQLSPLEFPVADQQLIAFLQLIEAGKVSNTIAYQRLLPALIDTPDKDPLALAEALNILQSSDSNFLEGIAKEVLEAFPDKVATYKKGKKGLLGFFMGEVMKRSRGKADPKAANQILRDLLK